MIDKATFAAGMALLAGTFGRNADPAVNRTYYQVLSPALSTEEFERAVHAVIAEESFWPSPAVLLAKAGARSGAEQALAALVDDLRSNGGFRFYPHECFRALPEPVQAGVRAIGGLREITLCPLERFAALERRFVDAYREAVARAPRLSAPSARDRQLPAGDVSTAGV